MMNDTTKNELKEKFSDVHFNEPLKKHTSFRTGGDAEVFIKPTSIKEFAEIISYINIKNIPLLVIGSGTNLLVKDNGVKGVVLSTKDLKEKKIVKSEGVNTYILATAGIRTQTMCNFAIENSLKGMNFAVGIPGTIGGAVWMNAGTQMGSMEDVIHSVKFITDKGDLIEMKKEELKFFYRKLSLTHLNKTYENLIIADVSLKLKAGDSKSLKKESQELFKKRKENQPLSYPNGGSFFKNPSEKPAGMLIDLCGLKGLKVGGAMVSNKHANFIINSSDATTNDILDLASIIKEKVYERFQINLKEEVQIVGS